MLTAGLPEWQAIVGHVYNSVVVDGGFGLLTVNGQSSFDAVTVSTDDPAFREEGSGDKLMASAVPQATVDAENVLTYDELTPIVDEAIERWADAVHIDDTMLAMLLEVTFQIVDLDGLALGYTSGTTVQIDIDAADHGWFVDTTPSDDMEFSIDLSDGQMLATSSSEAFGRMDLLTVVMHELGHVLAFEDVDPEEYPDDLMSPTLDTGVRRLDTRTAITTTSPEDIAVSSYPQVESVLDSDTSVDSGSAAFPADTDLYGRAQQGKGKR